jgi:hypothetical protein
LLSVECFAQGRPASRSVRGGRHLGPVSGMSWFVAGMLIMAGDGLDYDELVE